MLGKQHGRTLQNTPRWLVGTRTPGIGFLISLPVALPLLIGLFAFSTGSAYRQLSGHADQKAGASYGSDVGRVGTRQPSAMAPSRTTSVTAIPTMNGVQAPRPDVARNAADPSAAASA